MTCFSDTRFASVFSDRVLEAYGWQVDYALIDSELAYLSCYKAVNMINGYKVSFKMLDTYVSEYEVLGHEEIQSHIEGNLQPGVVNGFMRSNPNLVIEKCHLHNGHDFLNRICYHICNDIQNRIDEDDLQELIVNTYTEDDFHKTRLYNDVAQWEASHRKVWN